MIQKYILLLFSVLSCGFLSAQEQDYSVYKKLYSQEHGLPSFDVFCGTQDQRGFLWFGTRNGLCRFDGTNFEIIAQNFGVSKTMQIESLVADDKESIVITYVDVTIMDKVRKRKVINTLTYQITSLAEHFPEMPFVDNQILAVYKLRNGALGFFTEQPNSIWHYSSKEGFKESYTSNPTLKRWKHFSYSVNNVFERDDFLFLAFRSFKTLLITNDTIFTLPWRKFSMLGSEEDGARIFSYDTTTLKVTGSFKLDKYGQLSSDPLCRICKLEKNEDEFLADARSCDNDNSSILIYSNGISLFNEQQIGQFDVFENVTTSSFAPNIYNYFKDREGNYWICTGKGLVKLRISKNKFQNHFSRSKNFKTNYHAARGIYADDKIFCVNLYDMTVIKSKKDTNYILRGSNYGLLHTDTGLWIGAFNIRFYDFRTKINYTKAEAISKEIWSIFPLSKNKLLLGCTGNLDLYDITTNKIYQRSQQEKFPRPIFVYKISRTPSGEIWAVADNGIFVLSDQGEITNYYGSSAKEERFRLPFSSIHDVFFDKEGACWIATNGEGLCKWRRELKEFECYDVTKDFPSNVVYGIQEDEFDNLWVSTDYGLVKFNKKTKFIKTYTQKDGLSDNEFNRTSQFKSSNGRIYFGTVNGVTSFNPAEFAIDTTLLNFDFHISKCHWYNQKTKALEDITARVIEKNKIVISPFIDFFIISFALLNYEDGIHNYAYKIEGLDKDWNYIGENKLRFSNLPYGNYVMHIKAKTPEGYWNNKQIKIELIVEAPFHKTWMFTVILFIACLSIFAAFFYYRLRQKLKYLDRMNVLRLRLASDLHDEVGGLLNKSAIQSEMAKNMPTNEIMPVLDKIASNCRNAMSSMRDIMWNLDSRNDNIDDLLDRLREYAQNMLSENFDYTIKIEHMEDIHLLPETRQAIYLIYKESINNIIKHAREGKVEINIKRIHKKIQLRVYNSGSYLKNEFSTGQGLRNMRMRAEKVKGTFSLNSSNGVEIFVEIPL